MKKEEPRFVNPLYSDGFFQLLGYNKFGMVHYINLGVFGNLKILYFFCLKIFFTFTNSVDPDEMQHYAAFHLDLHCLQKCSFRPSLKNRFVCCHPTGNF